MRLLRIGPVGDERSAALASDDHYVDLSDAAVDFDKTFFRDGRLERHRTLCVGLNFRDHAAETSQAVPEEPIPPLHQVAEHDGGTPQRRAYAARCNTAGREVELGIVIGRRASYLNSVGEAAAAIAAWTIMNDERDFQLNRGGQWLKGKSAETFTPTGPWLVTPDEAPRRLPAGSAPRRRRRAAAGRFHRDDGVRPVRHRAVHQPVPRAGARRPDQHRTPPSVGMGFTPPIWLRPGDVMELEVDGFGRQRQMVVAP